SAAGGSYSLIRPDVPRPPFLETDEDEPVSKRSRIRVSMYHLPWIVIPSVVADDRGRTRRLLAPPARESSADRPARHRWVAPSEKGRWGRKRPTVRWMARSTIRATLLTATPRAGTRRRARRTPRPCRPPPPG